MLRSRAQPWSRPGVAIRRRVRLAFVVLMVVLAGWLGTSVQALVADPGPLDLARVTGVPYLILDDAQIVGLSVGLVIGVALFAFTFGRRISADVRVLEHERSGLQEAYDRARLDALRDGLTGLGNHRAFQEELDVQVHEARTGHLPLAVLMIDVDDLKAVNDKHGHRAGDELLGAVAQVLRANTRREDRAYRIGGDEFVMLLPDTDGTGAEVVANHILAATLAGNHGRQGGFSVTIGVTAFPEPSADRQQLILHADAALYSGKRHGRTAVERFDPTRHGMADDVRALPELAAAVTRVATSDGLRAVFQPIHSLKDGRVLGYEGLVRLQPDSGFDGPSALFIAAEATRRTVELDVASARTVLRAAGSLAPEQYLSINLSPRTLESEAFSARELLALARQHGVLEQQLVIEITEREAIEDLTRVKSALDAFRRRGARIAVDDVGAGNAGLRLLREIEFDVMKVDLSLVRAGAADDASEAVLRALVDLARSRRQTILAEGIETADQLEAVLGMRFDAGQGYLLGRPDVHMSQDALDLVALLSDVTPAVAA